eukprot:3623935-Rhodomonas_salina.1
MTCAHGGERGWREEEERGPGKEGRDDGVGFQRVQVQVDVGRRGGPWGEEERRKEEERGQGRWREEGKRKREGRRGAGEGTRWCWDATSDGSCAVCSRSRSLGSHSH